MDRDELEVHCIKWMHWMLEGNTDKAHMILERILAALTQEPNQPKGEGEHTLLTKVYLSTNNVACHSYEVKTFPGGISLGLSDYITGHYEPITEKN